MLKPCSETFLHKYGGGPNGKHHEVAWTINGWGSFDLPIYITFKKELNYVSDKNGEEYFTVEHPLHFGGVGQWATYKIVFNKIKL